MPTYEYELFDKETGQAVGSVSIVLPVGKRDSVCLVRRTAPRSINIGAAATPMNQGKEVLAGYHKLEERHGSRVSGMLGEFTPKQIKEAWSNE